MFAADDIPCCFLPIDWQFAVERFLRQTQPRCGLIVETEIWPNLFLHAHYLGIPITIINGRMSERTYETNNLVRGILCRTMEAVYAVLARSEEDAQRFIDMSFDAEHLSVTGNLKFAASGSQHTDAFQAERPYILAASTRPGEERLIVECWQKLELDDHLLIIVPRHPKRLPQIISELAPYKTKMAIRSRGENIEPETRIYIADTFGELDAFIAGSRFVIMGGSFKPFGGQNILEAARAGKAVIFGPYMDNFQNEAAVFLKQQAGLQVKSPDELCKAMAELIAEPEQAIILGDNGARLMQEMGDMAERYLKQLESLLPLFQTRPAES